MGSMLLSREAHAGWQMITTSDTDTLDLRLLEMLPRCQVTMQKPLQRNSAWDLAICVTDGQQPLRDMTCAHERTGPGV